MRRPLLLLALLFGLVAMHGGLGQSCPSSMSSSMSAGGHDMSAMALHHAPATPASKHELAPMAHCIAPLPPGGVLLLSLALVAVLPTGLLLPLQLRNRSRPTGREPPRPRWLDPVLGLGVLRT